jgi:hypothetical protein
VKRARFSESIKDVLMSFPTILSFPTFVMLMSFLKRPCEH